LALLVFFLGVSPFLPALGVVVPEALYTAVVGFLLLRVPQVRAALMRAI
jgi:hypothetical protein